MLRLNNISMKFPNFSLENISFEVDENECVSIIGPTGSGKSCILRAIGGVYNITEGSITFRGKQIQHLPPEDRNVGLVFQDNALFPHLNVYDNIAFGLRARKHDSKYIDRKIDEYAELFSIERIIKRSIHQLSGGEKQRVSLARALVIDPSVLLLDEPFSALDRLIHEKLITEFKSIFSHKKMMVVHVTHDQTEANILADRIAIIKDGKIMQHGTVDSIFKKPNCKFVADFVNTQNVFKGKATKYNGSNDIVYDNSLHIQHNNCERTGDVNFCIRPEYVYLHRKKSTDYGANVFRGVVNNINNVEAITKITVNIKNGSSSEDGLSLLAYKMVEKDKNMEHKVGDEVFVHLLEEHVHLF